MKEISDLAQLFQMLQKNMNEFEMNGVKYKLNVGSSEIESLLSLQGGSEFSNKPSDQSNQENVNKAYDRRMTEIKKKKKVQIKINTDEVTSLQPFDN